MLQLIAYVFLLKLVWTWDVNAVCVCLWCLRQAHVGAAMGRVEILKVLKDNGGDFDIRDEYNVSTLDIISNPGPIQAEDAWHVLGIKQRPARKIDRLLNPEMHPKGELADSNLSRLQGWPSTGGWGTERQPNFETDMECDVSASFGA